MYIDNSAPEIPNRKIIVKNSTIRTSEIKTNLKIASPSNKDTNTNILLINSQKHSERNSKTSIQNNPSINHKEAINYFLSTFLSKETEEGNESVKENKNNKVCCLSKVIMKLFPRVKIKKELENDLHFISYLLSLSFNSNDNLHNKIFNSIKLFFIDNANSYKKETLSIFSLLLILSMYQLYPSYMLKIFTLAKRHIVSLFDKVTSICQ